MSKATSDAGPARAALQSVGFQTSDLWRAMRADWSGSSGAVLRVDGGMSANDWAMQFLADLFDAPVDRPAIVETTALGVALLAGMRADAYPDQAGFAANWARERRFTPKMDEAKRKDHLARLDRAVAATQAV